MNTYRQPNVERLLAACRREKLDRVPNFEEHIDTTLVSRILGKEAAHSNDLAPDDAVELARRTHQDAIWLQVVEDLPPWGTVCSMSDIDSWQPNDPIVHRDRIIPYCRALEGTSVGLCVGIFGPFMQSYMAMGPTPIEDFLVNLYEDRELVETVMERQLEAQTKLVEAIMELPIDIFYVADDTCDDNGFMCSPETMNEIWVPRMERLVGLIKQKGVPIQWHCCGKLDPVLPLLVQWGPDLVEPVQTSCNDIYALKEEWGEHISFRGNMNIEGVLAFGTPDEVRADTREHIDRLSYDGGYVVSSSHSITAGVPLENYRAMIETAVEFGRY